MSNPSTIDVSVSGPCTAEQRINSTNPNLYAGGTGDFVFVYVYSVSTPSGTSWEIRTYDGPSPCNGQMLYTRDTVANDPVGSYSEVDGDATAVVTPV